MVVSERLHELTTWALNVWNTKVNQFPRWDQSLDSSIDPISMLVSIWSADRFLGGNQLMEPISTLYCINLIRTQVKCVNQRLFVCRRLRLLSRFAPMILLTQKLSTVYWSATVRWGWRPRSNLCTWFTGLLLGSQFVHLICAPRNLCASFKYANQIDH
jgi:hypothetical protein